MSLQNQKTVDKISYEAMEKRGQKERGAPKQPQLNNPPDASWGIENDVVHTHVSTYGIRATNHSKVTGYGRGVWREWKERERTYEGV